MSKHREFGGTTGVSGTPAHEIHEWPHVPQRKQRLREAVTRLRAALAR
jgi:hypothetical protein